MGSELDEQIKRWIVSRKSALIVGVIQIKTAVSETYRYFDLPPSEIEF